MFQQIAGSLKLVSEVWGGGLPFWPSISVPTLVLSPSQTTGILTFH